MTRWARSGREQVQQNPPRFVFRQALHRPVLPEGSSTSKKCLPASAAIALPGFAPLEMLIEIQCVAVVA
jgi:hypothetical protein